MIYFIPVLLDSNDNLIGFLFNQNSQIAIFTTEERMAAFLEKKGIDEAKMWKFDTEENKEFLEKNKVIIDPK